MGITAVLETEDGNELASIEDPENVLHRLLPPVGDQSYAFLGSIDRYGDTVFNHLQVPRFLLEWRSLSGRVMAAEDKRVFHGIEKLAEQVTRNVHAYLKFYGD